MLYSFLREHHHFYRE
ncbi:unnamed protein product [Rhodiola kirilowii]